MKFKKQKAYTEEWALYEKGKEYNRSIGLYDEVDTNERFYRGDQWTGVAASGLPTPVFNFFKRIIDYYISNIASSAVKMSFRYASPLPKLTAEEEKNINETLKSVAENRWEKLKMDKLVSDSLYDAAVTGDAFAYTYWDPSVKTGQAYTGDFKTVLIDNTNVFFGNPNSVSVQTQPYILISGRELVCDLRKQAEKAGVSKENMALIVPDSDTDGFAGDMSEKELENTKCVTLIKLWKNDDGKVMYRKSVKDTVIIGDTDTGLTLYPLAYYSWTRVKNSWHGRAVGTGLKDNQIFINKGYAMVMKHMMDTAFSKVIYDSTVIEDWSNKVGEAVAVNGPVENVAAVLNSGSMQSGMLDVINMAISHTKDFLGATDSALGSERADNTSAIIALQQASAQPLENVRRSLYQFIEDIGLIWLNFMFAYYPDERLLPAQNGKYLSFPFSRYREALFECNIDVGASGWWSEVTAVNTLDNLLKMGLINTKQYLERLPENIIPRKKELIESIQTEVL
ncbi:MAG: hypothetical protein IKT37_03410 [Clostridia bacterium]|nr:hypothetical protein [Clostridia bacterium]